MQAGEIYSQHFGEGFPLVLLHAFPLSHLIWESLQSPPGFRLILPDFPGFGESPLAASSYNLAEAAQALRKNLDATGVRGPIILGGISMGGYWALEFVRQFPEGVQGLILISTKASEDKPEARERRLGMAAKVEKEGTEYLVGTMIPGLLGKTTLEMKPQVGQKVKEWILGADPAAVALAQRAMAVRRDQRDMLPGFKMKTLILAGQEDALIPFSESEDMARMIPEGKFKIFKKTGHLIPLECPDLFQNALNDFLFSLQL